MSTSWIVPFLMFALVTTNAAVAPVAAMRAAATTAAMTPFMGTPPLRRPLLTDASVFAARRGSQTRSSARVSSSAAAARVPCGAEPVNHAHAAEVVVAGRPLANGETGSLERLRHVVRKAGLQ